MNRHNKQYKLQVFDRTKDGEYIELEHFFWRNEWKAENIYDVLGEILKHPNVKKIVVEEWEDINAN